MVQPIDAPQAARPQSPLTHTEHTQDPSNCTPVSYQRMQLRPPHQSHQREAEWRMSSQPPGIQLLKAMAIIGMAVIPAVHTDRYMAEGTQLVHLPPLMHAPHIAQ